MKKIKSFTDLIAWQKGHQLVIATYKVTDEFGDAERNVVFMMSLIILGASIFTFNSDLFKKYDTAKDVEIKFLKAIIDDNGEVVVLSGNYDKYRSNIKFTTDKSKIIKTITTIKMYWININYFLISKSHRIPKALKIL